MVFGDQLFGDFNDFCNMVCCVWFVVGMQNIQCVKIFVYFGNYVIDQCDKVFVVFISVFNDFVVDIGDIVYVFQFIVEKMQIVCYDVKGDEGMFMVDMIEIVNGNIIYVYVDFFGMDRFKFFFLVCQCIKNF